MPSPMPAVSLATPHADLEASLSALESQLAALGAALQTRDTPAIDSHACELPQTLARAVARFSAAAQRGPVPAALRQRLARASSIVAAQREALARATAALDRAIDVLMPRQMPDVYSAGGTAERAPTSGSLLA